MNIMFVTEEEAKAYLLPPNSTALLMHRNEPIFYIKATDSIGQSTIKAYRFEEIKPDPSTIPLTQADLQSFKEEILSLLNNTQQQEDPVNA